MYVCIYIYTYKLCVCMCITNLCVYMCIDNLCICKLYEYTYLYDYEYIMSQTAGKVVNTQIVW